MIFESLAIACVIAALIPALLAAVNLCAFRPPPAPDPAARPRVSLLIPARDEEARIELCVRAALQARDVELEVIVLDDDSQDRTADIVRRIAAEDSRLRLESAPPLPPGWCGKQHACHVLSGLAKHPLLVFIDADVRLEPHAMARMAAFMGSRRVGLASGFPKEETGSLFEDMVIPLIHVLLLGYLPIPFARWFKSAGFAAGCGQLMIVRREAYRQTGGHSLIPMSLHDGIKLPRAFRRAGIETDLFDATGLASCRMYRGAAEVWSGLSKNAVEGMATPVALPIWTLLLLLGHVLPFVLLPLGWALGVETPLLLSLAFAAALALALRFALAVRFRQSLRGALLHPVGVLILLAVQWTALVKARLGRPAVWRGRRYEAA